MHATFPAVPGRFILIALLAALPQSASATWLASGNAVANQGSLTEQIHATQGNQTLLSTDERGGLILGYTRDLASDSVRVQRLDHVGGRQWNGSAGKAIDQALSFGTIGDGDGGAWSVASVSGGMRVQHFDASGAPQFAGAGVIATPENNDGIGFYPALAVTASGKLLLAAIGTAGSSNVDSIYIQRVTTAGTMDFPGRGALVAVHSGDIQSGGVWNLIADGEGGVLLYQYGSARRAIGAQRFNASGVPQWGAIGPVGRDGVNVFSSTTLQAVDASATWSATNGLTVAFNRYDGTLGTEDICAQRVNTAGTLVWGTASSPVVIRTSAIINAVQAVDIAPDGSTGCIVGWADTRGSIYAQRLNGSGTTQWASGGVAVNPTGHAQDELTMCSDNAGGAYLGYHETVTAGTSEDVAVSRVSSAGTTTWTTYGRGAAGSGGVEKNPLCAPDGTGGVLLAWEDDRDAGVGNYDVYAKHVGPGGAEFVASLVITAPNGGETLMGLTLQPITWTSNVGGNLHLEYSINNGAHVNILSSAPTANGTANWSVPAISSTQVKVHATLVGDTFTDASDAFFTICPAFDPAVAYPTITSAPHGVVRADFNEDGILDLAVATGSGVAVMLGGGVSGVGNGTFPTVTNYAIASPAQAIVAADFTDDGILDLMVSCTNGVYRLIGQGASGTGNGTFGAAAALAGVSSGRGIVSGDFDGDGILDIAVAENGANVVSVLIGGGVNGGGNGSFVSKVSYAVGTAPVGLAAGHFNGDGVLDLAVAESGSSSVGVLLGITRSEQLGDGTFAPVVHYATIAGPQAVVVSDFNGDGPADLAVACNGGSLGLTCLVGNTGTGGFGNGTFKAKVDVKSTFDAVALAVVDIDRDGLPDLVSVSASGFVQFVVSDGNGAFTPGGTTSVGTTPAAITVGDFDEDSRADLAVANTGTNNVSILLQGCAAIGAQTVTLTSPNGGNIWEPSRPVTLSWTSGADVIAVDLEVSRDNGRNWQPIATNLPSKSSFTWRVPFPGSDSAFVRVTNSLVQGDNDRSNSRFTICPTLTYVSGIVTAAGGPKDLAVVDFDGDGILDAAMTVTGGVSLERGQGTGGVGDGTFAAAEPYPIAADGVRLVTADFNGDGLPDLAATRAGGVSILLRNPSPTPGNLFLAPVLIALGAAPNGIAAGDFDEDGITDLVVGATTTDQFFILRGDGVGHVGNGAFIVGTGHAAGDAPTAIVVGDFNGDGVRDLAFGGNSAALPGVTVCLGLATSGIGNGTFGSAVRYPTAAAVVDVASGDFDEDGITDLATLSTASLGTLAGTGTGAFGPEIVVSAASSGVGVHVGDANRDGRADLFMTSGTSVGFVTLFPGNGTGGTGNGTFGPPFAGLILIKGGAMASGDFDEDGIPEVLVALPAANQMLLVGSGCPGPAGAYALATPNGGEAWTNQSVQSVVWTPPTASIATNVELSRDGGLTWQRLASGLTGNSYAWNVVGPFTTHARVRVVDAQLQNRLDASNADFTIQATTGVDDVLPQVAALTVAGPMPARGIVRLVLSLPAPAAAQVEILDVTGRRQRVLAGGAFAAGRHGLDWDGRGDSGEASRPGVYFVHVRAGNFERTVRIVRL